MIQRQVLSYNFNNIIFALFLHSDIRTHFHYRPESDNVAPHASQTTASHACGTSGSELISRRAPGMRNKTG